MRELDQAWTAYYISAATCEALEKQNKHLREIIEQFCLDAEARRVDALKYTGQIQFIGRQLLV